MVNLLLKLVLACPLLALISGDLPAESNENSKKPLKVFILAGQSNMQGHARTETLEYMANDAESAKTLGEILNQDGSARIHKDVWINSLSSAGVKHGQLTTGFGADENKIGPELMFGIQTSKKLDEPILIIKTAWGGKSLHTDFRPPSAAKFRFSEQQLKKIAKQGKDADALLQEKHKASGEYYRLMVNHIRSVLDDISSTYKGYDSDVGFELAGFVWFQGWNDMVDNGVYPNRNRPGGFDTYTQLLTQFIRDVRNDLNAHELPFVIGVMGAGGPTAQYGKSQTRNKKIHQHFRDAMSATAANKEFQGNVSNVFTERYWDNELGVLKERETQINNKIRQLRRKDKMKQPEAKERKEEMMAEQFTAEELVKLRAGVSNQAYHYLGSAKIMTGIGHGFAEAMTGLLKQQ